MEVTKEAMKMSDINTLDAEVNQAYINIVGEDYGNRESADQAEEAFSGQFRSDKDFAQEMADQLGLLNDDTQWPYTCIDWDYAGRELMYDYSEDNGYYFRNL